MQANETPPMAAPPDDLLVERKDNGVRITINRPQRRNALTDAVLIGMRNAFVEVADDPSIRAVVLTGAGDKAFCAGADLTPGDTPFQPDFARLTLPLGDLARAVHAWRVPIVGRINGMCLAGGMGLFGLCDMAIASEEARFGMPEVKIGIFPMQILTLLRDLIPPRFLNEMCMTGRPIDARTALRSDCSTRWCRPRNSTRPWTRWWRTSSRYLRSPCAAASTPCGPLNRCHSTK